MANRPARCRGWRHLKSVLHAWRLLVTRTAGGAESHTATDRCRPIAAGLVRGLVARLSTSGGDGMRIAGNGSGGGGVLSPAAVWWQLLMGRAVVTVDLCPTAAQHSRRESIMLGVRHRRPFHPFP